MKENDFTLKKAKCKQYFTETIIDTGYMDDLAFLTTTQTQANPYCIV